ncbi:hypothetical protein [Vibrio sp. 16]|uniref:hypothetical protein n=1 Tax=Vibrio sp. 16 TaxID=391586 RepID=UPI00018F1DE2|nr:hypothetical protein [Vibrio sp. 16]EED25363.1 hypothetical protein VPMS16_2733 [Vibrio sp. 16]CAK4076556.1 hypothetical protein PVDT1_36 [Vibrio sp. 16]
MKSKPVPSHPNQGKVVPLLPTQSRSIPQDPGQSCQHLKNDCPACNALTYFLNRYLCEDEDAPNYAHQVDAIWQLHFTKMQLERRFAQLPSEPQPEVMELVHTLQSQLSALTKNVTQQQVTTPLSLLLAVLAKETEMMLLRQKSQWWRAMT